MSLLTFTGSALFFIWLNHWVGTKTWPKLYSNLPKKVLALDILLSLAWAYFTVLNPISFLVGSALFMTPMAVNDFIKWRAAK